MFLFILDKASLPCRSALNRRNKDAAKPVQAAAKYKQPVKL